MAFADMPIDTTGYFSQYGRVRVCDGDGQGGSGNEFDWVRRRSAHCSHFAGEATELNHCLIVATRLALCCAALP